MRMTSQNPRRPASRRAARALRIWIAIIVVVAVAFVALFFSSRIPPAQRAYYKARRLLAAGEKARAAAQCEQAIKLDPELEDAWHCLLEASPTPAVCRRFAENLPQLFDTWQPIHDSALLIRRPGWDSTWWERSRRIYSEAVGAQPADAKDPVAAALRLDYDGRKELTEAWDEVRKLREELKIGLKIPLPRSDFRIFAMYDLAAVRKLLTDRFEHFRDRNRWLNVGDRVSAAIKKEASGLAKLNGALDKLPDFVPTRLTLAYARITRGQFDAAEKHCRELLTRRATEGRIPGETHVRFCLARALELTGHYNAAAAEVRSILDKKPKDVQAMLRLGALYLKLDRLEDAEQIADELLEANDLDPRPNYIKGVVSLRREEYEEAATQLSVALKNLPYSVDVHYYAAIAKARAGQHVSASTEFAKVAEQTPNAGWPLAASAASGLANAQGKGADEAAEALLREEDWLKADPRLRDYGMRFRVAAAALEGRHEAADLALQTLIRRASDRRLADYLVAGMWVANAYTAAESEIKLDEKKLEFFRAAAGRPSAHYCLAFLLAAGGHIEQARTVLEKLVGAKPDYVLAALYLARLHVISGQTERAAQVLRHTGLAGQSPAIRRALAAIDSLQGLKLPSTADSAGKETSPEAEVIGPHLAFLAMTVDENHRAYAQRLLLLDPVDEQTHAILRLTYTYIRRSGLKGVTAAAKADQRVNMALRRRVAIYQATRDALYRLVIGRFWQDIPPHL